MKRIGQWSREQIDCDVCQFRKEICKERLESEKSHAEESGFSMGRVLALSHKKVKNLTASEVETFLKRYQVVAKYKQLFMATASDSIPYWTKFYDDRHLLTGSHPGPRAQAC